MENEAVFDRMIRDVVARVFQVPPEQINDRTRRGSLEQWDSLGHLNLFEAVCAEFDVQIPPEQALEMDTVADIKRIVRAARDGAV